MAFNNSYTAVTGATYTASHYNTHTRDNFTALWVYTTAGDMAYATSSTSLTRVGIGSAGEKLVSTGSAPTWIDDDFAIEVGIGNGITAITTGVKIAFQVPVTCEVEGWEIVAPLQSGSIVVDVWKDTYANFPPTVADTIAGSEKPTLSSAQKGQDASLSTWTTALTKNDWLLFNVESATTVTMVIVSLQCRKTAVS